MIVGGVTNPSFSRPIGINSLAALVQVEPKIALDYQMVVMDVWMTWTRH